MNLYKHTPHSQAGPIAHPPQAIRKDIRVFYLSTQDTRRTNLSKAPYTAAPPTPTALFR